MDEFQTIFWRPTGPKLSWDGKTFLIEDLNPDARIEWRMDARELEQIGERCLQLARDAKGE
jgi:hypothetical protein